MTALGVLPVSLLGMGNHILSGFRGDDGDNGIIHEGRAGEIGPVALVGSADGTLALWPTAASRPHHTVFAHSDAVVAIRTAMDAPPDVSGRPSGMPITSNIVVRHRYRGGDRSDIEEVSSWTGRCPDESLFFVVSAGANCEVKVWGIGASSPGDQEVAPLTLGGYTVVGTGPAEDRLTAVELLSERLLVCGFASGAVEVWPIPFDCRGGTSLATTRAATQVFSKTHEATVTSITLSLALTYPMAGGGEASVGRCAFTTSADNTVVRWASLAPGNSLRPLRRYCLSSEATAVVLLPPASPTTFPGGRPNGASPPHEDHRIDIGGPWSGLEANSAMFRVVAALDRTVIVLELATAKDLLVGISRTDVARRHPRAAVAHAFPGIPRIPRMAFHEPSKVRWADTGGPGFRWTVGGVGGREAGCYEVIGGTRGLSTEWSAAGNRRIVAAVVARHMWEATVKEREVTAHGQLRASDTEEAEQQERTRESAMKPRKDFQTWGKERGAGKANDAAADLRGRQTKSGVKSCVKTVIMHPSGSVDCGTRGDGDGEEQEWYRRVRGGKTVKLAPEFATGGRRPLQMLCSLVSNSENVGVHTTKEASIGGVVLHPWSSTFGIPVRLITYTSNEEVYCKHRVKVTS